MNDSAAPARGLATPDVARLCRLPITTLNNWVDSGLCGPGLIAGSGPRATRYWSVKDVVVVRAIRSLRQAGCSMQNVRQVAGLLETHWGAGLADSVLFWDGRDVISIDPAGSVVSLIQHRGQTVILDTVIHLMTFPLGAWLNEAEAAAVTIDVAAIRDRRAKLAAIRASELVADMRTDSASG